MRRMIKVVPSEDEILYKDLEKQNPWWKGKEAINEDKDFSNWEKCFIKWESRIKNRFDFDKDIVYTLRGLRQIGKTTLLKILIRDLLDKVPDPKLIFYYNCGFITIGEFRKIINFYLTKVRPREERAYLFLDDISAVSSVKSWQKAINQLWYTDNLKNTTVILTGTNDIKELSKNLVGIRGDTSGVVEDKPLLPMKFAEYVETRESSMKDILEISNKREEYFNQLINGNIPKPIENLGSNELLKKLFEDYLYTGGIPYVINNYVSNNNKISEEVYDTYIKVIYSECGLKKKTLLRIMKSIIHRKGNLTQLSSLANDIGGIKNHTILSYIDKLEDIFVLYYTNPYEIGKVEQQDSSPQKDIPIKIYFHDPFFCHAFLRVTSDPKLIEDKLIEYDGFLAESVVGDHLIRLAFSLSKQKKLFLHNPLRFIRHWKNNNKVEVDFILNVDGIVVPIEVKYQQTLAGEDKKGIKKFRECYQLSSRNNKSLKYGILLSNNDKLENDNGIITLPIWLFLMLI